MTPNGIQQIVVFVAMCKGFLEIEPHFKRRLAPLMARRLPMYEMTTGVERDWMALSTEELPDSEIQQRLRDASGKHDVEYPIEGHPPMRPEEVFLDLVRLLLHPLVFLLLS